MHYSNDFQQLHPKFDQRISVVAGNVDSNFASYSCLGYSGPIRRRTIFVRPIVNTRKLTCSGWSRIVWSLIFWLPHNTSINHVFFLPCEYVIYVISLLQNFIHVQQCSLLEECVADEEMNILCSFCPSYWLFCRSFLLCCCNTIKPRLNPTQLIRFPSFWSRLTFFFSSANFLLYTYNCISTYRIEPLSRYTMS